MGRCKMCNYRSFLSQGRIEYMFIRYEINYSPMRKNMVPVTRNTVHTLDGFTLIEMLVVISIIVVIASIVGSILVTSFRGEHKSNSLTIIRQNGDYAISQMAKS